MITKPCPFMWPNTPRTIDPTIMACLGMAPHHMLAQLQRGDLTKEIHENHGIAIYTFIDHHINRAIGTMRVYNQWEQHAPFYTLDAHDRLVRKGDFTSGRPSGLFPVLGPGEKSNPPVL